MLNLLKKRISEKIFSLVVNLEKKEKIKAWQNLLLNSNINIHDSFQPKDSNIFKGKGNEYGQIVIGEKFYMKENGYILVFPEAKISIGKRVFFNNYCSINCLEKIEIGDDTMFGEGVKLYDHNHLISHDSGISISKAEFSKAPIIIGKNCWIASNVIILKGVTIGDNSIIGAGCVIHKSVPPNSIVKNSQNLITESF